MLHDSLLNFIMCSVDYTREYYPPQLLHFVKRDCVHADLHRILLSSIVIKLIGISGPSKWRPPQWPSPHHQSKPVSPHLLETPVKAI